MLLANTQHIPSPSALVMHSEEQSGNDHHRAAQARALSGRRVITGDFLAVDLPSEAAAIIGNPPFNAAVVASFLDRAHTLLRDGGRCGFILPAYIHQTHSKVLCYAKYWSIRTELRPRNLFPGLS